MIQCIIMSRPPPPLSKARTMCLPARPSLRSRAADLIGVGLSLACLVHCLALPLLLLAAPALSAWLSLPESFHAVILLLAAPAAALALADGRRHHGHRYPVAAALVGLARQLAIAARERLTPPARLARLSLCQCRLTRTNPCVNVPLLFNKGA